MAEYLAIRRHLEVILSDIFYKEDGFAQNLGITSLKPKATESFQSALTISKFKTSYEHYHGELKQGPLMPVNLPQMPVKKSLPLLISEVSGELSEFRVDIKKFTVCKFIDAHKTLNLLNECPSSLLLEGLNLIFETAVSLGFSFN